MNCVPVIGRELLVAGRRPAAYRQRVIAATAVVLFTFAILLINGPFSHPAALSKQVFVTVSLFAFAYALLAGVFLTTDCICSERQDGTLPLLFLTRLNGFDVALGKLVSTSAVAGYALLAVMPVLGLPTMIGGVTGAEFARVCLVLVVTLLWSLTTGLLCSTLCRDSRRAMGIALGIVLLTCLGFGVIWARGAFSTRWAQFIVVTPGGALLNSFDVFYSTQTGAGRYWQAVGLLAGFSIAQFAAASLLLRRYQAETPVGARSKKLAVHRTRRRPIIGNPYRWLLQREQHLTPAATVLGVLLLLVLLVSALVAQGGGGMNAMRSVCLMLAMFTVLGFHWVVKSLAALNASRLLAEQRQSGALEILLTTPLSPQAILEAHRKEHARHFRGLALCGGLINLVLLMIFYLVFPTGSDQFLLYSSICVGGAILLPVDCSALRWIVLHEALTGKRHDRAVLSALLRVFPLAWVAFILGITMLIGARGSGEAAASFYFIWAMAFGALTAATGRSRALLLQNHFRSIAAGDGPHTTSRWSRKPDFADQRTAAAPQPSRG